MAGSRPELTDLLSTSGELRMPVRPVARTAVLCADVRGMANL
jgi:hypothetical protein